MATECNDVYTPTARILHWVSAILFVLALAVGLYFSTLDYRNDEVAYEAFLKVIHWHKTFGILVLALALFRIGYRYRVPPPSLPTGNPAWMRSVAMLSHGSLYLLTVVLGLTGLVASDIGNYAFLLFDRWPFPQLPGEDRAVADRIFVVHMWLGNLAAWLVGIHVMAAVYHHFVLRDGVRM